MFRLVRQCCGKAWRHGSRDAKPQSSTSNSIATSKLLNWFDRHVEVLACTTAHWEAGQLAGPSGHGGGVRTWSGGFGACVSVMEWTDWESCREFLSDTDVFFWHAHSVMSHNESSSFWNAETETETRQEHSSDGKVWLAPCRG